MKSLNYLNAVINNKSAFVPVCFAAAVVAAASALSLTVCTGMYDSESDSIVLYLA